MSFHHRKVRERLVALDVGEPKSIRRFAVKLRSTRSSWTAGPGFLPLRLFLVPKQLHHWLAVQIRHTVRSQPVWPGGPNFIGQESVAELGVVGVGVEDSVSQVGLVGLRPPTGPASQR